jgi:hypothetical protein
MVLRFLSRLLLHLIPFVLLTGGQAAAQSISFDGNRWYEIEVSIFSNESPLPHNEMLIPDKTELSYPEPIRNLVPASQMYRFDFDTRNETPDLQINTLIPIEDLIEESAYIGPQFESADTNFRLTDFTRDPFIALGNEHAQFQDSNNDLIESADYRLLFHSVWRQPVMDRIQSEAIFIAGGDRFGEHHELEGNLRFSFNRNGDRVDVEARLWLVEFSTQETPGSVLWQLPVLPESIPENTDTESMTLDFPVNYLSFMHEERAMISNELHYLDHPDFGLLVQIRPYQLPEPVSFSFE